jgi:hypothetical protein
MLRGFTPDWGLEPVSARTLKCRQFSECRGTSARDPGGWLQPVSRPSAPEFVLKIHRAETGLRILGVSHEMSGVFGQRPGSWPLTLPNDALLRSPVPRKVSWR